jgi:hypothetical protein
VSRVGSSEQGSAKGQRARQRSQERLFTIAAVLTTLFISLFTTRFTGSQHGAGERVQKCKKGRVHREAVRLSRAVAAVGSAQGNRKQDSAVSRALSMLMGQMPMLTATAHC